MYKITLEDGTELKGLELNGNNFISPTRIDDSVFADNLGTVFICDGENTDEYHDMQLVQNITYGDGKSWFILREKTQDEKNREAAEQALEEASSLSQIAFVVAAQKGDIDDVTITEHPNVFVVWSAGWRGKAGDIVRDDGLLYRSIHDVTDAGQNRKPSDTPSMWTKIGDPSEEWPTWSMPIGAHDAYEKGAKVTHKDRRYISQIDANTAEPDTDERWWKEHIA